MVSSLNSYVLVPSEFFLIQNLAPFLQYVALGVVLISLKNQRKNKQEISYKARSQINSFI